MGDEAGQLLRSVRVPDSGVDQLLLQNVRGALRSRGQIGSANKGAPQEPQAEGESPGAGAELQDIGQRGDPGFGGESRLQVGLERDVAAGERNLDGLEIAGRLLRHQGHSAMVRAGPAKVRQQGRGDPDLVRAVGRPKHQAIPGGRDVDRGGVLLRLFPGPRRVTRAEGARCRKQGGLALPARPGGGGLRRTSLPVDAGLADRQPRRQTWRRCVAGERPNQLPGTQESGEEFRIGRSQRVLSHPHHAEPGERGCERGGVQKQPLAKGTRIGAARLLERGQVTAVDAPEPTGEPE